jgi:hypothetical protein
MEWSPARSKGKAVSLEVPAQGREDSCKGEGKPLVDLDALEEQDLICFQKISSQPGVVVHTCNPSTQEAEAGR